MRRNLVVCKKGNIGFKGSEVGDKYDSPMEVLWILGYWTGEELKACKRAIVGTGEVNWGIPWGLLNGNCESKGSEVGGK